MNETMLHIFTSLGSAVFNSIWQAGLIWLLVLVYIKTEKVKKTDYVETLAFWTSVAGFISFLSGFIFAYFSTHTQSSVFVGIIDLYGLAHLLPYIAIAYLGLLIFPLIRLFKGIKTIYVFKKRHLFKVPGHLKIFTLNGCSWLGIKRKVKIFISDIPSSPLTLGWLKPMILIPLAAINNLSTQQVEAIILHELAHIKRNDYLKNFINQIILAIMYFNPFIRALIKIQNLEREKSADDWVVRFEYDKTLYATALYSIASSQSGIESELIIAASGKNSELLHRIEFLLGTKRKNLPNLKKIIFSLALISFLSIISLKKPANNIGQRTNDFLVAKDETFQKEPVAFFAPKENTELKNIPASKKDKPIKQKNNPSETQYTRSEDEIVSNDLSITHFASSISPLLSEEEEKNIETSLYATKKILSETIWKQIEFQFAETMTDEQKLSLKKRFEQNFNYADWNEMETKLRQNYYYIDWSNVNQTLKNAVKSIQLDSLYKNYSITQQKLLDIKKSVTTDAYNPLVESELAAVDKKLASVNQFLKYIEQLRRKRIIEL